jgi:hypothetical protein
MEGLPHGLLIQTRCLVLIHFSAIKLSPSVNIKRGTAWQVRDLGEGLVL